MPKPKQKMCLSKKMAFLVKAGVRRETLFRVPALGQLLSSIAGQANQRVAAANAVLSGV